VANKDRPHHNARRAPARTLAEKRQAKREKHPPMAKKRKLHRKHPPSARLGL
jgi:hypothetical protein